MGFASDIGKSTCKKGIESKRVMMRIAEFELDVLHCNIEVVN